MALYLGSLLVKEAQSGGGGNTDELEAIIDNSGVLDSTEGSVEEKVEQLIDKAEDENAWYKASENIVNANNLFQNHQGVTIPRTNLISATSLDNFIKGSKVEYIDYYLNTPKVTSFQYGLASAPVKKLKGVDTSKATQVNGIFANDRLLETIEEPLDFSSVTQIMPLAFNGCSNLKNISFVAETIKLSIYFNASSSLSAASVQSIIDGLATVTTAQTLTLNPNDKILQSQVDTANAKGWTIAGGKIVSEEEYYG